LSRKAWSRNTFGFKRMEVVGALAISCFLYALSLNIFLEAMKRFFYVEPLENPQLIVIVGGKGLLMLIFFIGDKGLFLTLIDFT
jgi:zinc transporter 1